MFQTNKGFTKRECVIVLVIPCDCASDTHSNTRTHTYTAHRKYAERENVVCVLNYSNKILERPWVFVELPSAFSIKTSSVFFFSSFRTRTIIFTAISEMKTP
ncbi:hypothetical protein XELAEV_18033079mg [Xenopus laevis]|uniref:Uncharacterized protein n=1 Tax=Xenopus laevis TaxID=8355 RepID=A0A974CJ99_XENLA|nr:hypothetical protein XELAEV_18033079mg [Xenopus laevis]